MRFPQYFGVAAYYCRSRFATAIGMGLISRQPCRDCGAPNAFGHHDDYSKPLDVIWLCTKHHAIEHARQGKAHFYRNVTRHTVKLVSIGTRILHEEFLKVAA